MYLARHVGVVRHGRWLGSACGVLSCWRRAARRRSHISRALPLLVCAAVCCCCRLLALLLLRVRRSGGVVGRCRPTARARRRLQAQRRASAGGSERS